MSDTDAFITRQKILSENGKGSKAARRLIWLLGKADISNVKRILDIGSWDLEQSIEMAFVFDIAVIDAFEPLPLIFFQ